SSQRSDRLVETVQIELGAGGDGEVRRIRNLLGRAQLQDSGENLRRPRVGVTAAGTGQSPCTAANFADCRSIGGDGALNAPREDQEISGKRILIGAIGDIDFATPGTNGDSLVGRDIARSHAGYLGRLQRAASGNGDGRLVEGGRDYSRRIGGAYGVAIDGGEG